MIKTKAHVLLTIDEYNDLLEADSTMEYKPDIAKFYKEGFCFDCMNARMFDFDTQTYGKCGCENGSNE